MQKLSLSFTSNYVTKIVYDTFSKKITLAAFFLSLNSFPFHSAFSSIFIRKHRYFFWNFLSGPSSFVESLLVFAKLHLFSVLLSVCSNRRPSSTFRELWFDWFLYFSLFFIYVIIIFIELFMFSILTFLYMYIND